MGGDHKCPVCGSTFTRSQHVARHMRSHTGDRPYKCVHCGDQFARSDLLSRHVNKCHSVDKKIPNQPNNYRRKQQQQQQRQSSEVSATHHTHPQLPSLPPAGRPFYAQDEFAAVYQQSPRRYSTDAPDPPSLSSSSVTSMSSTSLDSLPHSAPPIEPVFHVPQQHHYQPQASRQWSGQSAIGGIPQYSFLPSNDQGGNLPMFKHDPYQPPANNEGVQQYNDLPTPLAYSGGPYRLDPFIPNQSQNMSGMPMESGMYMHTTQQSQNMPNQRTMPNGRQGEFSSAFGLMSLDDAAMLAGLSDGAPFFENQTATSPDGLQNLLPSLSQQAAQQANNGTFASGISGFGNADPNQNVQTPNTKEREMRTIREMWAAFLRDPTTGLKPDGTEMGKPEFPTPPSFQQHPHPHQHLHRRSSSYSGGVSGGLGSLAKAMGQSTNQYSHPPYQQQQQHSSASTTKSPHMPTAQHTLHGGTNVVTKLEDQASRTDVENHMAGTPAIAGAGLGAQSPESLRSYEEAILARKAPVLKLPAKIKTRESSGSANSSAGGTGSSILPSISQSGRSNTVGGGVASLSIQQQQQLPTASGASGVPPGSTPNTAFYSSQVDRPVIAMPKPRSRPTTANGPGSRPNTAGNGVNSAHGSQPSSRPGTASSNGGGSAVLSPRQQYNSSHSSPHPLPNAHSLPSSRPSTSCAPSPSYSFAFAPPPQFQNQPYPSFQPGSLPSDSIISPPSATVPSNPTSHQLVTALSNAGMLDSSTPANPGRPTYKRLASQVLEPGLSKRPHLRRGDTNFNTTLEDGSNESGMDGFDSEGMSDAGGSERAFGYDQRGYGAGIGHESEYGANAFINGRRMSEPAVAAPRMMMRMPPGGAKAN